MGRATTATLLCLGLPLAGTSLLSSVAVSADAQTSTDFQLVRASTHDKALWEERDVDVRRVAGRGQVVVQAKASACEGWPLLRVRVDGRRHGPLLRIGSTQFKDYGVGRAIPRGTHRVSVRMVNDRNTSARCDRNVFLTSVALRATPVQTRKQNEDALWGNRARVDSNVTGEGRVIVRARGTSCDGWPVVRVWVDGERHGDRRILSTLLRQYAVGRLLSDGEHHVTVRLINDRYRPGRCDRNVFVESVTLRQPVSPPSDPTDPEPPAPEPTDLEPPTPEPKDPEPTDPGPTPGPRPTVEQARATTGVPAGTDLRVHEGDLTIRDDGKVIDGLDIRGFVRVLGNNVTIKNSIVRGRNPGKVNIALVSAWEQRGLRIVNSTLKAADASPYLDGLKGHHFSAEGVEITNVVDTAVIFGDDVTIRHSWLHGNTHFDPDPRQSDGISHDDGIQIEGGSGIEILESRIEGAHNAAIMITQNYDRSSQIDVRGNSIHGGGCSINLAEKGKGPILNTSVAGNVFGQPRYRDCGVISMYSSAPQMRENYWQGTSNLVKTRFWD